MENSNALAEAASRGAAEALDFLMKRKADVNRVNAAGATPLLLATWKQHVHCARLLLDGQADPNFAEKDSRPPVYEATVQGSPDLLRLLLAHHAEPNAAVAVRAFVLEFGLRLCMQSFDELDLDSPALHFVGSVACACLPLVRMPSR